MDDIFERVRAWPPVDTTYRFGRHKHSLATGGLLREAKSVLDTARRPVRRDVRKFLIIGRARSGTTLLTSLLNAHPQVRCAREVLRERVAAPRAYLNRLARLSPKPVWGAKLLSYQMVQVQRFGTPRAFLEGLIDDGFTLVHLSRGTFQQTRSLVVAQQTRIFHAKIPFGDPIRVDPDRFLQRLEWNAALLEYERACLAGLPHVAISYEDDLSDRDRQRHAMARLFEAFGVEDREVTSPRVKRLKSGGQDVFENHAAIVARIRERGLGHLLE